MADPFTDNDYVRLIQEMDTLRTNKEVIERADLELTNRPIYTAWNSVSGDRRTRILARARAAGGGRIKRSRATRKHRKSKRRARQ